MFGDVESIATEHYNNMYDEYNYPKDIERDDEDE